MAALKALGGTPVSLNIGLLAKGRAGPGGARRRDDHRCLDVRWYRMAEAASYDLEVVLNAMNLLIGAVDLPRRAAASRRTPLVSPEVDFEGYGMVSGRTDRRALPAMSRRERQRLPLCRGTQETDDGLVSRDTRGVLLGLGGPRNRSLARKKNIRKA